MKEAEIAFYGTERFYVKPFFSRNGTGTVLHGTIGVMGEEPEYLTPEQVAAKLQLNTRVVRRLMAAGKLPGIKIGRIWRVSAVALRSYMQGSTFDSAKRTETPSDSQ